LPTVLIIILHNKLKTGKKLQLTDFANILSFSLSFTLEKGKETQLYNSSLIFSANKRKLKWQRFKRRVVLLPVGWVDNGQRTESWNRFQLCFLTESGICTFGAGRGRI